METKDKRVKREIANSNERRRMQSINAGFQKLKRLLPVNDGEKLSKAAILQHASEFIQQIERERLLLHEQNTLMRGTLIQLKAGTMSLDSIDLDSLPIIPINTHIAINTTISNNSSSSTDNSNDDCSKEAHSNNNKNTYTNSNKNKNSNSNNNNNNKVNNNGNNNKEASIKNSNNKEVNCSGSISSSSNKIIICSSINHDNNNYHELAQLPIASVAEIISDRVTSPNGLVSTCVAKAAIALPLEVPYTSETAIIHHDLHPPPSKMMKLEPIPFTAAATTTTTTTTNTNNNAATTTTTTTPIDPQDPPTKGQNLDTICKAIMEIEGDRVFINENIKHETT